MCRKFDAACNISEKSTPSKTQLLEHFKSDAIVSLMKKVETTAKGKESRILEINWYTFVRNLRAHYRAKARGEQPPTRRVNKKRPPGTMTPPTKRSRKKAKAKSGDDSDDDDVPDIDDDDDEVVILDPSEMEVIAQPTKGQYRHASKPNKQFEVPGQHPDYGDWGRIFLGGVDLRLLKMQGSLNTDQTMMAFHNLICKHYFEDGVRCSESDFVPDLQVKFKVEGESHGWTEYLKMLDERECSSSKIGDWNTPKVLLIQVFWGPREAGHYGTLVLDRTREGNHLAVYADSSPGYEKNAVPILKDLLQKTPLGTDEMTWIKATVPKQGRFTNDCGVFASCFSLLYVHGLVVARRLGKELEACPARPVLEPVKSVALELPKSMSANKFGSLGRKYMLTSTRFAKLEWESHIFHAKVTWN